MAIKAINHKDPDPHGNSTNISMSQSPEITRKRDKSNWIVNAVAGRRTISCEITHKSPGFNPCFTNSDAAYPLAVPPPRITTLNDRPMAESAHSLPPSFPPRQQPHYYFPRPKFRCPKLTHSHRDDGNHSLAPNAPWVAAAAAPRAPRDGNWALKQQQQRGDEAAGIYTWSGRGGSDRDDDDGDGLSWRYCTIPPSSLVLFLLPLHRKSAPPHLHSPTFGNFAHPPTPPPFFPAPLR